VKLFHCRPLSGNGKHLSLRALCVLERPKEAGEKSRNQDGIFVVLGILQVVMQIMGRIFAYLDAKKDMEKGLTQEEAAAVAMALYMYDRKT